MKRNVATLLMILLLVTLTAASAAAPAGPGDGRKDHPRIARAITALNAAVDELREAPHDFGGHKDEAIEACQKAITQLKIALAYREKHGG